MDNIIKDFKKVVLDSETTSDDLAMYEGNSIVLAYAIGYCYNLMSIVSKKPDKNWAARITNGAHTWKRMYSIINNQFREVSGELFIDPENTINKLIAFICFQSPEFSSKKDMNAEEYIHLMAGLTDTTSGWRNSRQAKFDERNNKKVFGYKLDVDLGDAFREACAANNISCSEEISKFMKEYIK